jgi:GNAT superfamily N-acetyltransferase
MSIEVPQPIIQKLSYKAFSESSKQAQEKIFRFLDVDSGKKELRSVKEEYPSVYRSCPGGESLYIQNNDEIASHVAFLEREFQHPFLRMRIGLIGSVATHPKYRGRGYATRLVKQACAELKKRGCVISLLWSDQPDFYLPLGFYRSGREQDLRFSPKLTRAVSGVVRPMDFDKDAHLIWRLYQKQSCRLDRSLEEQKKLLKIPNAKVFVSEKDDVLTSYIVVNKGVDFTDFIHEWGGEISEVQRNISYCQRQFFADKPLTLIAPGDLDISILRQISEEKWDGVLGLIKVLDKNMLLSTYMNYLKTKKIEHVWSKDKDSILFSDSEFSVHTDLDVIQLVFGDEVRNSHPRLPFFLWGFDSI